MDVDVGWKLVHGQCSWLVSPSIGRLAILGCLTRLSKLSIIHGVSSRARTTLESESHQQKDRVFLRTAQMVLEHRAHLVDKRKGEVPDTYLYGTGTYSQRSVDLSSINGCLAS